MSSQTSTFVDLQAAAEARRLAAWPTPAIQRAAERVERAVAGHPLLCDVGIAAVVAVAGLLGLLFQDRLSIEQAAFAVALSLPLLLRRRRPLPVFGGLALIAGLQWLIADPQLGDAALLVALYEVALRGSLPELVIAGGVIEAGAVMAAVKWAPSDPVEVWIGLSGLGVAAGVLGITVRQRRVLLASLHERAARLELERDQEGRLAAAAERNRIAREMHDIVAHNLSVMIALADGASYAIEATPHEALHATDRIAATGRDALLEMRRLLGVLGDDVVAESQPAERPPESSPSASSPSELRPLALPLSEPLAPQPRLMELQRLAERVRAAKVPVQLSVAGEPQALPEGVQLAIFRVAQEALTNTLKHAARPTSVRLELRCAEDLVELEVTDESLGTPAGQAPASPLRLGASRGASEAGRGLRGMRERALAYGGELQAGPLPSGGWRVQLRLRPKAGAEEHPDQLAS